MVETSKKKIYKQSDLKDLIVIFAAIILILVIFSFLDLFDELRKLSSEAEGVKIIQLLFVLILFGFSYAYFSRRRWRELDTELKEQEKEKNELQDNVNRLMSTVNLSPDAIFVHRESEILFVNKAGVSMFRAENENELIGKNVRELIHSSFREKVSQRIEQMVTYMKQVPVIDIVIRRLDGTYMDVSVASTPVYYHAIPHIITILRDITERKKAEELQQQLASIVLSTVDAIYSISNDGIIKSWNPGAKFMYGYTEKEAIGNPFTIILPKSRTSESEYILNKINKDETILSYETQRIRKDGTVIDVSLSVSPIKEGSGVITGASVTARDITFKKRAEEELRRYAEELAMTNEELYVFSYAASHDLQEPLRTIQILVQLLNERFKRKLDSETREYLTAADDGAARMYRLITDFLMYSRVGTDRVVYEVIDCNTALRDALTNLKVAIKESKAKVKNYELPSVKGNMQQITAVFQNLIGNSIKYQGENIPEIEISAHQRDDEWLFSVKDNGIGIEEWFSERIFIVFQKLHDHKKYPGSGIGLALCKRIVEKHGGKIWFESEAGKGTIFYFTLPVLKANEK
jgi:PAS domain S-box-containing protein